MVRFVVMAAGQAKRMALDKLTLPWRDSNILSCVLESLFQGLDLLAPSSVVSLEVPEIRVVARKHQSAYLSDKLANNLANKNGGWLQNPKIQPLSETIKTGLTDLSEQVQGICFVPADQVGLIPQVFADLTACFLMSSPDFLVPKANDLTGSPVFFHRRYLSELMALEGEQGGRVVLSRYPDRWKTYPVKASFFHDVDTIEQYHELYDIYVRR